MVASEDFLVDYHQITIPKPFPYSKEKKKLKRTDKILELSGKNRRQIGRQRKIKEYNLLVNESIPIRGFFGTVPWRWDQVNQRLIFDSGEFPVTYEYNNIRLQIQESSWLKNSSIKIITFTKPVKMHEESSYLFAQLHNLEKIENAVFLDVSNAMNIAYLFYGCHQLKYVDVCQWDLGKVIDMQGLFSGATSLFHLDVGRWDTSQVVNMSSAFENAVNLTYLDVSHWDVSNVWYADKLFLGTTQLLNLDVANWKTHKIYTMAYMFAYTTHLTTLAVNHWDVSNVRYMTNLFLGAEQLFDVDTSHWNTKKVAEATDGFLKIANVSSPVLVKNNFLSVNDPLVEKENIPSVDTKKIRELGIITSQSNENNVTMINHEGRISKMYTTSEEERAMVTADVATVVAEFTAIEKNSIQINQNTFANKIATAFLNDFYLGIDEYITGEINDKKKAKKVQLIVNDVPTSIASVSVTGSFEIDPKGKISDKNDQVIVIVLDRKGLELDRLVLVIEEKGYVLNVSSYKLHEQKAITGNADYFQTHVSLKINDEELDHQLLTGTREFIFDVSNQIEYEDDLVEVIGYSYGKEVTRKQVIIQKPSIELQASAYNVGDLYLTGRVVGKNAKKLRLYVNMRRKQELSLSGDGSFSLLGIAILSPKDKVEIAVLDKTGLEIQRFMVDIAC